LGLWGNQLTGEIPVEICNQGDSSPSLSNNQLCPPYPECIQNYVGYQDTSECEEYLFGDVNLDGFIDVLDIMIGVNVIIGNIEPTTLEFYILDYNQDNVFDVLDIVQMVDYIIGL